VQLLQTTLGAARRDGDELVVLDGTADVLAWAMSDDISGAMTFSVNDRVEAAAGPETPIVLLAEAPAQVDFEGEVAMVIGREARDIGPASTWAFIARVTAANDVSAQDVQMAGLATGIFAIPEIVATVSKTVALPPGDVILTGSPAGIGLVKAQFLSPGDVTEVTVGALPPLRNEVAAALADENQP
jgi:2-keto-4-pentenoate hydratase/2-oxohepta-3-ene-1,7-dioic acid hydratase in catechol pathway